MKTLTIILMTILILPNADAQNSYSLEKILTHSLSISLKEIDVIIKNSTGAIDSIELKDGAIVYDTEINDIIIKLNSTEFKVPVEGFKIPHSSASFIPNSINIKKIDGDGSGGG
tara:strand:+ start:380 stop:721 length:342 start_codon:yes stop_codon:yes gene_type:complete